MIITPLRATALAAMLALGACAAETAAHHATAAGTAAIHGTKTAEGAFTGASNHVTTGHASIYTEGGKWFVSFGEDFTFDGAPDPKVALGHDGFDPDALLAPLASNTGAQVYEIPAPLDVADYNEVWIWCEEFAVPLGVAKLKLL